MSSMTTMHRQEDEDRFMVAAENVEPWAVIYMSLVRHEDGQGRLGCHVYGPFPNKEAAEKHEKDFRSIEGLGYIRPMVNREKTIARISAD